MSAYYRYIKRIYMCTPKITPREYFWKKLRHCQNYAIHTLLHTTTLALFTIFPLHTFRLASERQKVCQARAIRAHIEREKIFFEWNVKEIERKTTINCASLSTKWLCAWLLTDSKKISSLAVLEVSNIFYPIRCGVAERVSSTNF